VSTGFGQLDSQAMPSGYIPRTGCESWRSRWLRWVPIALLVVFSSAPGLLAEEHEEQEPEPAQEEEKTPEEVAKPAAKAKRGKRGPAKEK
jgi:hypothetical protein